MSEELSLYWTELCRSFDLPKDICLYALIHFYTPLIQASKEFKLINECYLFCSGLRPMCESRFAFTLLLNNPKILLDTRIVDNRINIYVSLINLFIYNPIIDRNELDARAALEETLAKLRMLHNKENKKRIEIILEKGLECNNLEAFEIIYQMHKEMKEVPLLVNIRDEEIVKFAENIKTFIKRTINRVQLDPTLFNTFPIAFQEKIVLSSIKLEDYQPLAIFLFMMDNIEDVKYKIIQENWQYLYLLRALQMKYKKLKLQELAYLYKNKGTPNILLGDHFDSEVLIGKTVIEATQFIEDNPVYYRIFKSDYRINELRVFVSGCIYTSEYCAERLCVTVDENRIITKILRIS